MPKRLILALAVCAVLAACSPSDESPAVRSSVAPTSEVPATVAESTTTTTAPIESTTTTEPAPVVTAPPAPILCPGLPHPGHHEPCPGTRARAPRATAGKGSFPAGRADLAASAPRSSGPRSCIARYESEHGLTSPNVFQFEQGTWDAYGGTGSPGSASMSEQNAVFDRAWADAGPQHWAAQRGRCF